MSSGSVQFNPQRASFSSTANYDLLLSRVDVKDNQALSNASIASGETNSLVDGMTQLRRQFEAIRNKLLVAGHVPGPDTELGSDPNDPATIDWEFWQQVVDDYSTLARTNPVDLSLAIASGVPSALRGVIWQIITTSKSNSLEELYASIVGESSPHEAAIRQDLASDANIPRTMDSQALYDVIKVYSLFDPEIGYTEGMVSVAVPLLANMPAIEAFCLLVKLMKDYGLRDFFLSDMPGLHLRLYQFDRILEDTLPDIHIHLSRQGVRSSMYTTQWFLTLFSYKFPLAIVQRIYDVVMTEGIEALLKFAVGVMRRNTVTILSLEFDELLVFLKDNIFDFYKINGDEDELGVDTSTQQYRINDLVADAYDIKVLPITLQKYVNEYEELHRLERERSEEVEELRSTNSSLAARIRLLETNVTSLTSEHLEAANELAQERTRIGQLEHENEDLTTTRDVLDAELTEKQGIFGDNAAEEVSSNGWILFIQFFFCFTIANTFGFTDGRAKIRKRRIEGNDGAYRDAVDGG